MKGAASDKDDMSDTGDSDAESESISDLSFGK